MCDDLTDDDIADTEIMHRLAAYPMDYDGSMLDYLRVRDQRAAEFHASPLAALLLDL